MTDLEKLARDICWAGFHYPPKGSKARYWKLISPRARESYVNTAKEFVWIAQKLGPEKVKQFASIPTQRKPHDTSSPAARDNTDQPAGR